MQFTTLAVLLAAVSTAVCAPTAGGYPPPSNGGGPNNGNGGAPTCSNQAYKPNCCNGTQKNILLGIIIGLECSVFSKTCNQQVTCCQQQGLINVCDASLVKF